MKSYDDKTALITGASSGIGEAMAHSLAKRGAHLVLTARSKDKLEAIAQTIRSNHGCRVDVFTEDLSQANAAQNLYEQTKSANIDVDLLVNNAGFGKWGEFLEFDADCYDEMLILNINSLVRLTHLFLPAMLERGSGGIMNVASVASFIPVPLAAVYSASKSFVLFFSEALYGEYADKGITIMALCPGGTETGFADVANADVDRSGASMDSPEMVAEFGLDEFSNGNISVIPGGMGNKMSAWMPRFLSRKRTIKTIKKVWGSAIGRDV